MFAGVLPLASGNGSVKDTLNPPPLEPDTLMLFESCSRSGSRLSSPGAGGAGLSALLLLPAPATIGLSLLLMAWRNCCPLSTCWSTRLGAIHYLEHGWVVTLFPRQECLCNASGEPACLHPFTGLSAPLASELRVTEHRKRLKDVTLSSGAHLWRTMRHWQRIARPKDKAMAYAFAWL